MCNKLSVRKRLTILANAIEREQSDLATCHQASS